MSNDPKNIRPMIQKYGIVALAVMYANKGDCTEENCEKLASQLREVKKNMLRKGGEST